jgi:2-polyprenyl-3-methyl-5-hydroxy-6-metoxy-1,4-benzoquinol methylase
VTAALPAQWYDKVLPGSRALAPLETSSALPVYQAAAGLIPAGFTVVDVGCGTGRFAELLRRNGQESYLGFDFAPAVVEEASRYSRGPFVVADIREWEHGSHLPDVCCYVMLEVLEHLDDDVGAVERIPPGCPVVFSVPNFWSESHVRRYLQPRHVFERFGSLLDFDAWQAVAFPTPGRRIHVFRATRRGEEL